MEEIIESVKASRPLGKKIKHNNVRIWVYQGTGGIISCSTLQHYVKIIFCLELAYVFSLRYIQNYFTEVDYIKDSYLKW